MCNEAANDATRKGLEFIEKIDRFCNYKARWLIKIKEETNPEWGWIPIERPLEKYIEYGVINLDKPPGPTSHEVVAWIKRMFNIKRAGHGGTLESRGSMKNLI